MTNLDVLGKLDDFSDVFDLDYFRENKRKILNIVSTSALKGKPADKDLVKLMSASNYDTMIYYSLFPIIYPVSNFIINVLKKVISWRSRKVR